VQEEPYIYPHLSGLEYLQLVGRLRGLSEGLLNRKSEELLSLFGLVAVPGLLLPVLLYPFCGMLDALPAARRDPALWTHMCFYVSFPMLVIGLASIVEWDNLLPDLRDYRILTPLPVRLRTLFAAKCSALLLFMLLFAAAVNTASSVMFPLVAQLRGVNPLRFMTAHGLALFAGTAFTSCLLVALQGLAMNVLSFRWFRRISPLLQSVTLVRLVCMFFLFPKMSSLLDVRQAVVHPALLFYPPAWFVGLYVELLGKAGPAMRPGQDSRARTRCRRDRLPSDVHAELLEARPALTGDDDVSGRGRWASEEVLGRSGEPRSVAPPNREGIVPLHRPDPFTQPKAPVGDGHLCGPGNRSGS
jgi:hypothetical protein